MLKKRKIWFSIKGSDFICKIKTKSLTLTEKNNNLAMKYAYIILASGF